MTGWLHTGQAVCRGVTAIRVSLKSPHLARLGNGACQVDHVAVCLSKTLIHQTPVWDPQSLETQCWRSVMCSVVSSRGWALTAGIWQFPQDDKQGNPGSPPGSAGWRHHPGRAWLGNAVVWETDLNVRSVSYGSLIHGNSMMETWCVNSAQTRPVQNIFKVHKRTLVKPKGQRTPNACDVLQQVRRVSSMKATKCWWSCEHTLTEIPCIDLWVEVSRPQPLWFVRRAVPSVPVLLKWCRHFVCLLYRLTRQTSRMLGQFMSARLELGFWAYFFWG